MAGGRKKKKVSVSHAKELLLVTDAMKKVLGEQLPFNRGTIFFLSANPLISCVHSFVFILTFPFYFISELEKKDFVIPSNPLGTFYRRLLFLPPGASSWVLVLAGNCATVSASGRPFPLSATDLASTGCSFQLAPPFTPRL